MVEGGNFMYEICIIIRHGNVKLCVTVYDHIGFEDEAMRTLQELREQNPHNQFFMIDTELDG